MIGRLLFLLFVNDLLKQFFPLCVSLYIAIFIVKIYTGVWYQYLPNIRSFPKMQLSKVATEVHFCYKLCSGEKTLKFYDVYHA